MALNINSTELINERATSFNVFKLYTKGESEYFYDRITYGFLKKDITLKLNNTDVLVTLYYKVISLPSGLVIAIPFKAEPKENLTESQRNELDIINQNYREVYDLIKRYLTDNAIVTNLDDDNNQNYF